MSQDGGDERSSRAEYFRKYHRYRRARLDAQFDALSEVMNAVEEGRPARVQCEGRTFVVSKSGGRMWLEIRGSPSRKRRRRFF